MGIPLLASVGVVMAFSPDRNSFLALAIGAGVGVVTLLVIWWVYNHWQFNRAQHASVDTYNDLCQRMDYVLRVEAPPDPDDAVWQAQLRAAQGVAARGLEFKAARAKRGIHWVLGTGYLDLTEITHRAEEELLLYEPREQLLADALADQARLIGSQISGRDNLLICIRCALSAISATSVQYLPPPSAADEGGLRHNGSAANGSGPSAAPSLNPMLEARAFLRHVRYQVNTFRDERRRRLMQVRRVLMTSLFVTSLATVLLLVLLIIGHPATQTLLGGAVLYVIGMVVGLWVHLSTGPDPSSRQEDYGLATVALFQIAALSGIAAVLGAYVGATFPAVVDSNSVTNVTGKSAVAIPSPDQVYDLAHYPVAVILALIFAMTPQRLVQRLSAGVIQTQRELQTSSAGD